MTDGFPPVPDPSSSYELRFTFRALADLSCSGLSPADLEDVLAATPWPAIVREFCRQRTLSTQSTEGYLHNVGRPDIAPLHGPAGQRACTWFDNEAGVCWFLGFTQAHDYKHFEDRAAVDELLPSEDDDVLLELEREERDFITRVTPGVRQLCRTALEQPEIPQQGIVGGDALRLEVTAVVVPVDTDASLADIYFSVVFPIDDAAKQMPGWPGKDLLQQVAEIISSATGPEYTPKMPTGPGSWRTVDPARELAGVLRTLEVPAPESPG